MKTFLLQQLERYVQRLEELDFLLSREDIMADMSQFLKLSREHADVSAVAKRYVRYQERRQDLDAGHALAASSSEDLDMKAMADEEIQSASLEMAELEVELQRMLLPKDPDDARPAYLEIRAGTGGDESALFAARRNKRLVEMQDFEDAKDKIVMGPERKSAVMREEERRNTAFHESGHAVVAKLLPKADPVHKVTIMPRGMALGLTWQLPEHDRVNMYKDKMLEEISILFGGRLAEEIFLNSEDVFVQMR